MKSKLLMSIGIALGAAFGTTIAQLVRHGAQEIEWARVLFMAAVTFTALLLIPRKWIEKPRS